MMNEPEQQDPEEQGAPALGGHRRETERRRRHRFARILTIAGLVLIFTALVIPATGYYVVFIQPIQETSLVVNDTRYSWGDYMTRLRMVVAEAQATGSWQPESMNNLVFDMLNEIERQEIVRQYAPNEGIVATREDVDTEIRARILGRSNIDDPEITESEFQERLRLRLEILKVSEDLFEDIARSRALERKLKAVLEENLPAKVMQRHLYEIKFNSTETGLERARAALDRIDAGESFSDLARELSDDEAVGEAGGDLGWIPLGFKESYDEVLFELRDGEVSGPVLTTTGTSLILAVGETELRDIRDEHRSSLEGASFTFWINERRAELVATGSLSRPGGGLSSTRYQWVLDQLRQDRELFPKREASG